MAMLVAAEQVQVVIVNPNRGPTAHGDEPGADIATHLARHGIKVEVQAYPQRNLSVGALLLARIADTGVDMVVLGAYGHARLRAMVLGALTRSSLRLLTLQPLLST